MPITIDYEAPFAVSGGAALAAGQGEYRKWADEMAQRQQQIDLQAYNQEANRRNALARQLLAQRSQVIQQQIAGQQHLQAQREQQDWQDLARGDQAEQNQALEILRNKLDVENYGQKQQARIQSLFDAFDELATKQDFTPEQRQQGRQRILEAASGMQPNALNPPKPEPPPTFTDPATGHRTMVEPGGRIKDAGWDIKISAQHLGDAFDVTWGENGIPTVHDKDGTALAFDESTGKWYVPEGLKTETEKRAEQQKLEAERRKERQEARERFNAARDDYWKRREDARTKFLDDTYGKNDSFTTEQLNTAREWSKRQVEGQGYFLPKWEDYDPFAKPSGAANQPMENFAVTMPQAQGLQQAPAPAAPAPAPAPAITPEQAPPPAAPAPAITPEQAPAPAASGPSLEKTVAEMPREEAKVRFHELVSKVKNGKATPVELAEAQALESRVRAMREEEKALEEQKQREEQRSSRQSQLIKYLDNQQAQNAAIKQDAQQFLDKDAGAGTWFENAGATQPIDQARQRLAAVDKLDQLRQEAEVRPLTAEELDQAEAASDLLRDAIWPLSSAKRRKIQTGK